MHSKAKADRTVGEGGVAQAPAEPVGHVAVEVELARLDQPHHADRDDQFADRRNTHRIVWRDAAARRGIGNPGGEGAVIAGAVKRHANLDAFHG